MVVVSAGIDVVVVVVVGVDVVLGGTDVVVVAGCEVVALVAVGWVVGGCVEGVASRWLVPQAAARSTRIVSIRWK